MGGRRPIVIASAGLIALAMTAPGAYALPADTAATDGSVEPMTVAAANVTPAPSGAYITVNGTRLSGFDPTKGGSPLNGPGGAATWNASGRVELHNLPSGWIPVVTMDENPDTGKQGAFYLVKGNGYVYRWRFDGATGFVRTADELREFVLTHNGKQVTGVDVTKDVTIHGARMSDEFGWENLPFDWNVTSGKLAGDKGFFYRLQPNDSDTPKVTYSFLFDAPTGTEGIESITAWLDDGSPVTGFDPAKQSGVDIPYGHDLILSNLPDGWTVGTNTSASDRVICTVTTKTGRQILYLFYRSDDYKWTYSLAQLSKLAALTDTGAKINNFDYQGGTWTVPANTTRIRLENVPNGWKVTPTITDTRLKYVISSPDGTVSRTYLFDRETPKYSKDDLKNAAVTANGRPVTGFDPTISGEWPVPEGATVALSGIPAGWTKQHLDGTLQWRIVSPDGSVAVTWRFVEVHEYSKNDLKNVTAVLPDGSKVSGFDPVNGGTFTVPAGTKSVSLENIPSGWNSTPLDSGIGFKVYGGGLSVTYRFEPAVPVTHTVTFDHGHDGKRETVTVTDGETVASRTSSRDGYTFQGWLLDGKAYDFTRPVTTDLTLTASWKRNPVEYTVMFDAGQGSSIPSQKVLEGNTVSKPADPTRDGYTFKGWQTGGVSYDFTKPVTGNLTLTAVWEENLPPTPVTHTIRFDSAGGGSVPDQTVEDKGTVLIPSAPTRKGYTFTGWLLNGRAYDFNTPVTGDLTLTAGWRENPPVEHTVLFDYAHDDLTSTVTVTDGQPVTRPATPTREGFTFREWRSDGKPYDFATPVTGNLTLTAVWEKRTPATYTVTFDTVGGSHVASQTVTEGDTIGVPANPTKPGCTFTGWLLDGKPYDLSTPVTRNLTLTAGWRENAPDSYTVTFDTNGGSTLKPVTVKAGMPTARPTDPTREGYSFAGWLLDGQPYDFTTPVTGNLTLTAKWEPIAVKSWTVTFDGMDGTKPVTVDVKDGGTVAKPKDPTREGYTFQGWQANGKNYDFTMPVTGNLTLKAMWARNETPKPVTHTVTFDTADGAKPSTVRVEQGRTVSKPKDPVRDGYSFTGWLLDGKAYDFATPVTGDLTLTAGWSKTDTPKPVTHTVTFDADNGGKPTAVTVEQGKTVAKPADPVRDGYTFTGWLLNGRPYDFATPVTGDLTLTAGWERTETPKPVTHTVTFDTADGMKPTTVRVEQGSTVTKPKDPSRDGYAFAGWTVDGGPYDFATPITSDLTITAAWERNDPIAHTVTFDPKNGNPTTIRKIVDGKPADRPADPTRDGYRFTGWLSDGKTYDFATPVTGNLTLTAGWERIVAPKPTGHTVTFDRGDGSKPTTVTVGDGKTVAEPATPTRDGYRFDGWRLDGTPYDFTIPVTGDLTLTAVWSKDETPKPVTHTVTFDAGDGRRPTTVTVEHGGRIRRPTDPKRDGYRFDGWRLDGKAYDFTRTVTADLTLTAVWSKTPAANAGRLSDTGTAQTGIIGMLVGLLAAGLGLLGLRGRGRRRPGTPIRG
ncbi:InlB B-repeat-containing protein [Bifidobacterium sp. SO1]|uniref:InlB B-repeat-containing protein n=1 Tax=Bifidobacterium sp. SO1 TaxID=2809029 RepID=UPI001BDDA2B7|nr:InlB B-repeat-containing protein [Bifidobacterium sp. SO1]MBT1161830.1 InlB B-repeat-containing protein [Bifidobacterium sp. SO1]